MLIFTKKATTSGRRTVVISACLNCQLFVSVAHQPDSGPGRLFVKVCRSHRIRHTHTHTHTPHTTHTHTHTHTHPVALLWTSDQPVAKPAPTQHTTNIRDEHPCPRCDSNLRSKQSSCHRPHGQRNWMLFVTHFMSDLQLLTNVGLQALNCCDRRFEYRLGHGCSSVVLVCVVQVAVCATGWSLVQRNLPVLCVCFFSNCVWSINLNNEAAWALIWSVEPQKTICIRKTIRHFGMSNNFKNIPSFAPSLSYRYERTATAYPYTRNSPVLPICTVLICALDPAPTNTTKFLVSFLSNYRRILK